MYLFASQEGYHEQSIRFLDACFIVNVEKSTTFFMPHLHIFYALFTHFLQTTRKQKMTNRCDTNIMKKNHITRFSLFVVFVLLAKYSNNSSLFSVSKFIIKIDVCLPEN